MKKIFATKRNVFLVRLLFGQIPLVVSTYLFLSRQFLNFSVVLQFLLVVINLASILVTVYLTREMRIRKFEDLLEIFSNNMEKLERKNITIIISNFIDSLYHLDYEEVNLIIDELVEKLLLEEGNKGKTVKIYGISD